MIQLEGMVDLINMGVAVRNKRLELGWTQGELAAKAQVSQGALSMFERSGQGMQFDRMLAVLQVVGFKLFVEMKGGA